MASAIGAASYKHPAWLIASEWLTFLIAFILVRQLARTEGDGRRLLAALLASAVSLSAYGLFQRTVELPDQQNRFENPQRLVQALAKEGIYLDAKDPVLEHWKNRVQANTVFATFAHPNSFASFLALLLPAAVAWTLASRRAGSGSMIEDRGSRIEDRGSKMEDKESKPTADASGLPSPSSLLYPSSSLKTWLGGACALLIAVAIWLTNSRGAILASAVAVGAVLALYPAMWWTKKSRLAGIATAIIAVILLVLFVNRADPLKEEASGTLQKRRDYWSATLGMIRDHPWLGVGPGHFGRFYPRYMHETAYQKIKDPHNFALEMWSTCGIVALVALMVTSAAFFWKTRNVWVGSQWEREQESEQEQERGGARTRWEFYLGGMAGLILGFLLWTLDLSKENISDQLIYGGFLAGLRSLIWFAAFGLYESLAWGGRPRALALVLGLVALLANLSISGGISFPSVAQPMWIVAALALNSRPQPISAPQQRSWLATMAPLPIAAVACLGFYAFIYSPVVSCSTPLREARKYYGTYAIKMGNVQSAESPSAAQKSAAEARDVLRHIVTQLQLAAWGSPKHKESAVLADPFVELAQWQGEEWKQVYRKGAPLIEARQQADEAAREATRLDPEGTEGYWAQYQANMTFAKAATTEVKKFYEFASQAMAELVKRDPTEARFHFLLADLYYLLDDTASWEREAQEALRLDEISTDPTRKLKPSQRVRTLSRRQPNDVQLQFQLAEALEREGLEEEVKPVAREINRLDREAQGDAKLTESQRRQVEAWLKSG